MALDYQGNVAGFAGVIKPNTSGVVSGLSRRDL